MTTIKQFLLVVLGAVMGGAALGGKPRADVDPIRWEPLCEPGGGGAIVSVAVSPHDARHVVAGGDMLGTAVSRNGGDSWQASFGLKTYEMASVTFHPQKPNEVWIGSCSGPYVSRDGGLNWEQRRVGMPDPSSWKYSAMVEKVLFDPANSHRLLAFGGTSRRWGQCDCFGWIWESTDAGNTWRRLGTLASDGFSSAEKKGANIVRAFWGEENGGATVHVVADGVGWWTSRDRGRTWTKRNPKGLVGPIESVTIRPRDPSVVWISTNNSKTSDGKLVPGGVFRSADGGETFTACDRAFNKSVHGDGNHVSHYSDVAVSPAAPDELFVSDLSWSRAVIYKSTDGGMSWTVCEGRKDTACFAGKTVRLALAPGVRGKVYGWNTEYILRSRDGGKTWDDATAYRPDPTKPDHWRGRGWNGWCSTDFVFNPYRKGQSLALAMDAGRGWLSDDALRSWRYTTGQTHPWSGGVAAGFSKDSTIYITTGQFGQNNGIQRSTDGGKTWTSLGGASRGLPNLGWGSGSPYGGVYVYPENGAKAWAACGGKLLMTTDRGESWHPVADELAACDHLAGDPTCPGRFYVKTQNGVYGTDDGHTFRPMGLPKVESRGRINCDARGRVLVCVWRTDAGAGVWRFDPATRVWTRLLDESLAYEANADPSDPSRLMVVTAQDPFNDFASGNGIWISADDGASWTAANGNLPMKRLTACAFDPFDPEFVVAGQYGGGFVKARWPKAYRPKGGRRYVHTTADAELAKPLVPKRQVVKVGAWSQGVKDTQVVHLGPDSLRMDGPGCAEQRLKEVSGPAIVTISGWMKVDGLKSQVAVHCFSADFSKNTWIQLCYAQDRRDWFQFRKTITLPAWTKYADLKFLVEGKGHAWVAEIKGE